MSEESDTMAGVDRDKKILLMGVFAVAVVGLALSGVVVADVLDQGAPNPNDGPVLTDWDPQLVNSSTLDRYQVTIRANNTDDGIALIRQRPQIQSNVTQRINMNASFGDATNPEIVAFEGDDGAQERINKTVFIDNGDVVVKLSDEAQGAQQQARVTAITVEFDSVSAPDPGFYNFTVDMEAQDTTVGQVQDFDTLSETGVAQVEVVDAVAADPGDLEVGNLETASSAPQDENQLEVTGRIDNTNTTANLTANVVYGLQENADPAFGGTDLLGQTAPNVTVAPGGTANVSFHVDLTEEDEAINTNDDIRHGIDVLGNNLTGPLDITDGPIDHSEDGGATLNRTTGLIQTAVDISSDTDNDVVTVNPGGSPPFAGGSPYGENVTVDVNNIVIQGNIVNGAKPAVAWTGPQIPDGAINPPFTVESTAENTTIRDLRIEPLIPDAGGVDILGGSNHSVLNNDIKGTNTGAPGTGVDVTGVTNPVVVSGNEIANKSNGVRFDSTSNGFITDNLIRDNSLSGIRLQDASENNTLVNNTVRDNGNNGILLDFSSENNLTDNRANNNNRYGIWLRDGSNLNNLTDNLAENNPRAGVYVGGVSTANGNTLVNNTARGSIYGIWVRNSQNNSVSESLAENNDFGIEFAESAFGFSSLEESGNTFTNDTSRNNGWDFVIETGGGFNIATTSISDLPVTNLDIGASTNPNTRLSFNGNDMQLRSVSNPQPDPSDATNISRYFEAQELIQDLAIEDEEESVITPQAGIPFLNVSVSYEDPGDLGTVDETTLELRRFNTTSSTWETVPGSTRDTANDLVSANITQFSDFGAFGEGERDFSGDGGAGGECINRRDLSRGQEDSECPFDRDISRGGSREDLDRSSGRAGEGRHRDSETARRNRGRGSDDRGR